MKNLKYIITPLMKKLGGRQQPEECYSIELNKMN